MQSTLKKKTYCLSQFHLSFGEKKKRIKDETAEIMAISDSEIIILSKKFNIDPKLVMEKDLVDVITVSYIMGHNARLTVACKLAKAEINDDGEGILFFLTPPQNKKVVLPGGEEIEIECASLKKIAGIGKPKNTAGRKATKKWKEDNGADSEETSEE